ncbi:hypothetical protein ACWDE0_37320 [Streptomyces sp. 900105755]
MTNGDEMGNDSRSTGPERGRGGERLPMWVARRTDLRGTARSARRQVLPDHWSFLLGEIALYCRVFYDGGYAPLRGQLVYIADSIAQADSALHRSSLRWMRWLLIAVTALTLLTFVGTVLLLSTRP